MLVAGTGSYITPRLTQAGQIIISPNTEPRSLSDLINFTQKSNLAESQLASLTPGWEQALRTVNRYSGTSQIYKEACAKYVCPGGPPVPSDVEIATVAAGLGTLGLIPFGVGVNPNTNRIYVANYDSGTVSVIDGSTNTIIANVTVGSLPTGIGVNPITNRIYVASRGSGTVAVIDGRTNTCCIANLTVGTGPVGVGVNPATKLVYVANWGAPTFGSTVTVINGTFNTFLTTVTVGTGPFGVGVDTSTNRTYVTNRNSATVSVINATNQVMATLTVGSLPTGVSVNPTTKRVYVANFGSNTVSVLDGSSSTCCIATVTVGSLPTGIGVNPSTNRTYVANFGANTVSVIDATNRVIANVTVGTQPFGVGVNPNTNRAYVTNRTPNTVSVIGRREEIREACLSASTGNCLVISSTGTLFSSTPQSTAVNLVAVSLRSNVTSNGVQAALTVICDNNTTTPSQQCSVFYVDGNVWGPGQTDLSKSPFIIQNAEPYFYLQFHWWDFQNSRIIAWGTWWYGTTPSPNWYWGVYWWWRTYVNYYIGIPYIPWWWWTWHWMYWRYWAWWGTAFQT